MLLPHPLLRSFLESLSVFAGLPSYGVAASVIEHIGLYRPGSADEFIIITFLIPQPASSTPAACCDA
jgi:hypothetical protein